MTYDNTNRGVIGANPRKTKETQPDITGKLNVDGREYYLDGWKKTGASGTFYSLSVKLKDGTAPSPKPKQSAPPADFSDLGYGGTANPDSDIPFAAW